MTAQQAVPSAGEVADYYSALGPLLRMAWGDNFHIGYWDGPQDRRSPQEAADHFTDLLIERLGVGPGDRVLDVGCGIGEPARRVATVTGAHVLGITISRQQVEQATELTAAAGLSGKVRFEYADGMAMPYPDGSYDAILSFESINHMDRAKALREFHRVLRPGGRLVLTDVTPIDDSYRDEEVGDVVSTLVSFARYPELVAGSGLVADELTDVTEQTKPTLPKLLDRIISVRKEFEATHGVAVQQVLDAAKDALPAVPGFGCLILVAHKP